MKLMEGECICTPARPSGQLPTLNRRMPQTVINTGSSSGTRLAAQLLDPHSLSKARRKLFVGDSEPVTPAAPTTTTEESDICQRLLEECQNKWNFDLINCVPLDGRFEWEKMEPENVPRFYSKSYTNPKRRAPNTRECYPPNMVANGCYNDGKRFREGSQSNESTSSCPPGMDVSSVITTKLKDVNNDNNTKGCNPYNIYNVPTVSISISTAGELENTNDKRQDVTDVYNDNLTHNSTYSCISSSSNLSSSSTTSSNSNNMGTKNCDGLLQGGRSPLMCLATPVENVNTSELHGSHQGQDFNNDNINNNNVFSVKSDTCDTTTTATTTTTTQTLTSLLREQLDNKQRSNLTAIDNNKATVSLPSLSSSSSSSSPSYFSSAPSSPSSLSPPSSSPLSSYSSSTTLPVPSSSSSSTTKSYSMEKLNETKILPRQTKIVDFMPHRKRTLYDCHTGKREKKLRKE